MVVRPDDVSNITQFSLEVEQASAAITTTFFALFLKKVSLDTLKAIVKKNPVLTGFSQNNWQVDINTTNERLIERFGIDVSLTVSDAQKALQRISATDPFVVVYIFNNAPYITLLEEGSSMQAPNGFVQLTLNEMKSLLSGIKGVTLD